MFTAVVASIRQNQACYLRISKSRNHEGPRRIRQEYSEHQICPQVPGNLRWNQSLREYYLIW